MAKSFNLTANLVLAGPNNLSTIVTNIQQKLGGIKATVDVKLKGASVTTLNSFNTALIKFNTEIANASVNATVAASAFGKLQSAIAGISMTGLKTDINTTTNAIKNLGSAASKVNLTPLTKNMSALQNVGKSAKTSATEMEEFGRISGLALRRFAGFSLATGVLLGFGSKVREGVSAAISFQNQLVRLAQIGGTTTSAVKPLAEEITRLSVTWGASSEKLMSVTDTLIQAGYTIKETKQALEALAKVSLTPTFGTMEDSVEGAIALMAQFKLKTSDLDDAFSSINAVAAQFAVESSDIVTAIKVAGGSFASLSSGLDSGKESLNKFMALFTSVRATTREAAANIATGLKTVFARMERPGALEAFEHIGVTLTDSEGKFVGVYEAINRISEAMHKMDPRNLQFGQLVELMGGTRQLSKVIPLITQVELRQKALRAGQQGIGTLTDVATKAQESWTVQLAKANEKFLALIRTMSESSSFKNMIQTIVTLANSFVKLGSALTPVLPYLATLAAFKGMGKGLEFLGVNSLIAGTGKRGFLGGITGHGSLRFGDIGANDVIAQRQQFGGTGFKGIFNRFIMPEGSRDQSRFFEAGNRAVLNKVVDAHTVGGLLPPTSQTTTMVSQAQAKLASGATLLAQYYGTNTPRFNEAMKVFIRSSYDCAKANYGYIALTDALKDAVAVGGKPSSKFGRAMGVMGEKAGKVGNFIGQHPSTFLMGGMMVQQAMGPESVTGGAIGGGLAAAGTAGMLTGGNPYVMAGAGLYGAVTGAKEASYTAERNTAEKALIISTKALDKAFEDLTKEFTPENLETTQNRLKDVMTRQGGVQAVEDKNNTGGLSNWLINNDIPGWATAPGLAFKASAALDPYSIAGKNYNKSEVPLNIGLETAKANEGIFGMMGKGWSNLFGGNGVNDLVNAGLDQQAIRGATIRERAAPAADIASKIIETMVNQGMSEDKIQKNRGNMLALGVAHLSDSGRAGAEADLKKNPKALQKMLDSETEKIITEKVKEYKANKEMREKIAGAGLAVDVELSKLANALAKATARIDIITNTSLKASATSAMSTALTSGNITSYNLKTVNKASNPLAYSGRELASDYKSLAKNFGVSDKQAQFTAQNIQGVRTIEDGLNDIAEKIAKGAGTKDFAPEKVAKDELAKLVRASGVTGQVGEAYNHALETKLMPGTPGNPKLITPQDVIDALKSVGMDEKVTKTMKEVTAHHVKMTEQEIAIQQKVMDAQMQYLQAQVVVNEKLTARATLEAEQNLTLQGITRPGYRATAAEASAPTQAKIEEMSRQAGVGPNTISNPKAIGDNMDVLYKKMMEQKAIIDQNKPGTEKDTAEKAFSDLSAQYSANQKLLEVLHSDNTRQTNILTELKQIEDKIAEAQGVTKNIYEMSPSERAKKYRELSAYGEYKTTGNLQPGVRGQEASAGFDYMNKILERINPEAAAEERRKFNDAILKATGYNNPGGFVAQGGKTATQTTQGAKLLADWKGISQVQIDAGNIILGNAKRDVVIQAANVVIQSNERKRLANEVGAKGVMDDWHKAIDEVKAGKVPTKVVETGEGILDWAFGRKPKKKATGGIIGGFYRGRDSELIQAMPGEFIVNRRATQANLGLLESINSPQGLAGGGYLAKARQARAIRNEEILAANMALAEQTDIPDAVASRRRIAAKSGHYMQAQQQARDSRYNPEFIAQNKRRYTASAEVSRDRELSRREDIRSALRKKTEEVNSKNNDSQPTPEVANINKAIASDNIYNKPRRDKELAEAQQRIDQHKANMATQKAQDRKSISDSWAYGQTLEEQSHMNYPTYKDMYGAYEVGKGPHMIGERRLAYQSLTEQELRTRYWDSAGASPDDERRGIGYDSKGKLVTYHYGEPRRIKEYKFNTPKYKPGEYTNAAHYATGGVTDTVPAMLTPGEFVVREPVARQNRNMLTQLNAGGNVGNVGGGMNFGSFDITATRLATSLDNFAKIHIPEKISITMDPMNITHTLTGDSSLSTAIVNSISDTLNSMIDSKIKQVINPDTGETKPMGVGKALGG